MEKYKKEDNYTYTLGMSLSIEAIENHPEEIISVYLSSKAIKNKQLDLLISLCKSNNIEIIYDDKVIDDLSLKENCYCIAFIKKYKTIVNSDKILALYDFKDEGELGTILRSAVSFDFKNIYLINTSIDIYDPKVIRASMGSFFHLNIEKIDNLNNLSKEYNRYYFKANGSKELKEVEFKKPFILTIPSSYNGLNDIKDDGFYLKDNSISDLSLSSLSSIVLSYIYHKI